MEGLKMFIVSDSLGETGALVTRAAMSQFKTDNYEIKRFSYVQDLDVLRGVLQEASLIKNSILIYTLVDERLIEFIKEYSRNTGLLTVDLISPLINVISQTLNIEPTREPGVIRRLDETYFKRVAAIEFAVKYDDGKDPRGVVEADIVLVGVSRTSKTPLSMYLANRNLKVANIPLVIEVNPPKELFNISAKKVIGLTNSPEKLNEIREERLKSLGLSSGSSYASLGRILDELEYADKIMKKIGCPIIDVSNRAIEETSEIVLSLLRKNGISFSE
ncbi:pyruvate, water dikinase regulatory protein [Tissierella sp. MB52-C2]|uniref:pyruvate, water dikinase regulatory protein n=1 Tax=Tissierella sp. MB52-C2 TaxID=3070999 RepID=UPI00280AE0A7|nr:pyruvate, water dikinase regulatory protein [Tissierella sp. MB52-C2]WMM23988.1 pyruvate, water dikinase regulatory protein [Tissierella sp. MB52-C2]